MKEVPLLSVVIANGGAVKQSDAKCSLDEIAAVALEGSLAMTTGLTACYKR